MPIPIAIVEAIVAFQTKVAAELKARMEEADRKVRPEPQQAPWHLLVEPFPSDGDIRAPEYGLPIPMSVVGRPNADDHPCPFREQSPPRLRLQDVIDVEHVVITEEERQHIREAAERYLNKHVGTSFPNRTVLAIGPGPYKESGNGFAYKCSPDGSDIALLCNSIAPGQGVPHAKFSHTLIIATPARRLGGIPAHKDGECEPGSHILALGAVGQREVWFKTPEEGWMESDTGDYISASGAHTHVLHKVESQATHSASPLAYPKDMIHHPLAQN